MTILYRLCPFANKKSPIYTEDKLKLTKMCLNSVINGLDDIKPEYIFILDSCPPEYKEMIEKEATGQKFSYVEGKDMGNEGSYFKQLELAAKIDDYVLFQEDDYFYLPEVGKKLQSALETFDFITPYDHPDLYFNEPRHIGTYTIKIVGNHHWRTVNSTCLTFGTHGSLIAQNIDLMKSHSIWDYPMWVAMRERGYQLWGPMPTLATHLVKGLLAPTIEWNNIWPKLA